MSLTKIPYLRYSIIDACLTNTMHRYPSLKHLRLECERKLDINISESSILKDINAMKNDDRLGFEAPIKYSKSNNGYYYSDPEFSIKKISLHDPEIEALKMAVDVLSAFSGTRVSENFNVAIEKVLASVHEQFPESSRKIIQTDTAPKHKGFENFELLLSAANSKTPVNFIHYSYKNRTFKSLIVHPYILKEFQNNWYLLGYSEEHKEPRIFGLDRIYEEINNYFENMYGVYPIENQSIQKIVFIVRPLLSDYLNAHPIHKSQQRVNQASYGHATFTLDLIPTKELINFFLSYSNQLIVKKPLWIQKEIIQHHKKAISYEERSKR
jgi:predicted DNA-binding transcriptional regulator YafY